MHALLENSFLNKHKRTPFRRFVKNIFIRMTSNRIAQNLLEEFVQTAHILQGLGGGSAEVETSGEISVIELLKCKVKPPYCIFDVGANKGQYLRLLLENIAPDNYSIHCFEPGQEVFRLLHEVFCHDTNIILNNIGMGNEICNSVLHYDSVGSGAASLTKRKLDHLGIYFDKCETVKISTIDNYCSENGIERINLLKIDVEGHEFDALNGARSMFERSLVDIVSFEFGACNVDTKTFFRDFWYFFAALKMKLFRITPSGYLYPIESYSEVHEKHGGSNIMAIRIGL